VSEGSAAGTAATHRVALPTADADLEVVAARFWAAGALGVWERPEELVAWFTDLPDDGWLLAEGRWSLEADRDWQEGWKTSIRPVRAGRTVIVPTWLADEHRPEADELTLVLDPGRAFGSGHHATTVLCLEALEDFDADLGLTGRRVADIGCGSGILAIAAAARGADVQAVDIDAAAIEVTGENAERNGVELQARQGSVEAVMPPVELVVANLVTDVVAQLAQELVATSSHRLIVSGITERRAEVALAPLRTAGARIDELRVRDGWIVALARTGDPPATS
jgi:ribosomal protein L11 methyltransferase